MSKNYYYPRRINIRYAGSGHLKVQVTEASFTRDYYINANDVAIGPEALRHLSSVLAELAIQQAYDNWDMTNEVLTGGHLMWLPDGYTLAVEANLKAALALLSEARVHVQDMELLGRINTSLPEVVS